MSKKAAPERITLTFDLHDLPTAQHRAGLAGLILQIDSMGPDGNQKEPESHPGDRGTHADIGHDHVHSRLDAGRLRRVI